MISCLEYYIVALSHLLCCTLGYVSQFFCPLLSFALPFGRLRQQWLVTGCCFCVCVQYVVKGLLCSVGNLFCTVYVFLDLLLLCLCSLSIFSQCLPFQFSAEHQVPCWSLALVAKERGRGVCGRVAGQVGIFELMTSSNLYLPCLKFNSKIAKISKVAKIAIFRNLLILRK